MLVSIPHALKIIDAYVSPLDGEIIPIEESVGRIALESYTATFNLPRFDNSAMDGYAVKVSDSGKEVACNKVIYAGDNPAMELQEHEAIKIMTGAPIPRGCVITSYSIHYTKLYEATFATAAVMVGSSLLLCSIALSAVTFNSMTSAV